MAAAMATIAEHGLEGLTMAGLGREVAIKELILSPAADPTALMRFLQEAQVMARTSHPNLVQVHDLEQIGDANYIVLEFVRGRSLRDRVNQGPIPLPQGTGEGGEGEAPLPGASPRG